jgi:UDP-2,3-diacylglucosamine pyrophosphatase LpxH
MTRVAGTRIYAARDDDRRRCLLFSDLHLPDCSSPVFVNFKRLLDDALAQPEETRVFILGDLFAGLEHHGSTREP